MALINNWAKNYGVFNDAEQAKLHVNLVEDLKMFLESNPRMGSCKLLTPRDCALILDFYENMMINQLINLIHDNLEGFVEMYGERYSVKSEADKIKLETPEDV